LTKFICEARFLKELLESTRCEGITAEGDKNFLANECVIRCFQGGVLETQLLCNAHNLYIHIVLKNVKVIEEGEIAIKKIKRKSDDEEVGLLDIITEFAPKEEIYIFCDGNKIDITNNKGSDWTASTVKPEQIEQNKDSYVVKMAEKYPVHPGFEYKNSAVIENNGLQKLAKIAKKLGKPVSDIVVKVQLDKNGLYATTGTSITNRSKITEKVNLESDEKVVRGTYRRGVGFIFPTIGKSIVYFGEGPKGTHMWIREVKDYITKDYHIPNSIKKK